MTALRGSGIWFSVLDGMPSLVNTGLHAIRPDRRDVNALARAMQRGIERRYIEKKRRFTLTGLSERKRERERESERCWWWEACQAERALLRAKRDLERAQPRAHKAAGRCSMPRARWS